MYAFIFNFITAFWTLSFVMAFLIVFAYVLRLDSREVFDRAAAARVPLWKE
jgi:cbb3-type cytochrome oxidase subunit 3